jgi:putative component of membrane protein insertase Oxa1/YidC/SpoIIIJ protein YidD
MISCLKFIALCCGSIIFVITSCTAQRTEVQVASPLIDDIHIYQRYLSSALGSNCGMFPSCSNYAIAAFKKKPTIMGFAKTTDRLLRCGNDIGHYHKVVVHGETRCLDLVDDSTNLITPYFNYDWLVPARINYGFICQLIDKKALDEALLEIHREQYQASKKDESLDIPLLLLEGICYLAKNEVTKVIELCNDFLQSNEWNADVVELLADGLVLSNSIEASRDLYNVVMASAVLSNKTRIAQKLVYLDATQGKWDSAETRLKNISPAEPYILSLINRGAKTRNKNPSLARALAIIPGLGYLYCEQPKTSLTAFLFNGMTAYASYDLLRRGQYGMGVLMTAMSMSFYIGNIYGSGRSAKKYNQYRNERILQPIEKWAYH